MPASSREEIDEAFDALHDAVSQLVHLSFDALSTPELLASLERLEQDTCRLAVPRHGLINAVRQQSTPAEIGGKLAHVLADRLRITSTEAGRRIDAAQDLGPRHALTGEPLPPRLPATAAGQRAGKIGSAQVKVIRGFLRDLPCWIDAPTRAQAEHDLAAAAADYRPELVRNLADRMAACLNPDGNFSDEDRARRRGLRLGNQQADGMSELRGLLTPEARATLEAALAKLGAPGMCNPADDIACVEGAPSQQAIDVIPAAPLSATTAGWWPGCGGCWPVESWASTTGCRPPSSRPPQRAGSRRGQSADRRGTILPMSDVIRLARHAHHYLAVFDKGKAIALYHTKRLASPGQRIVLYAKDRGCSHPGCDVAGYYCEVHHCTDCATCHTTDVNDLTFGCGPHHRLIQPCGWATRKRANGDTEWIPPPHLDRGQPRSNTFHHPEKLLRNNEDNDADDP